MKYGKTEMLHNQRWILKMLDWCILSYLAYLTFSRGSKTFLFLCIKVKILYLNPRLRFKILELDVDSCSPAVVVAAVQCTGYHYCTT